MVDRNPAPSLSTVPGIAGWHRAGPRLHIRTTYGTTFTVSAKATPYELRRDARRLKARAVAIEALADDLERAGLSSDRRLPEEGELDD